MRVTHKPTDNEIRAERCRRYLKEWPISKQMEAHAENAAGWPEKLNKMTEDFAEIRRILPFFNEEATE